MALHGTWRDRWLYRKLTGTGRQDVGDGDEYTERDLATNVMRLGRMVREVLKSFDRLLTTAALCCVIVSAILFVSGAFDGPADTAVTVAVFCAPILGIVGLVRLAGSQRSDIRRIQLFRFCRSVIAIPIWGTLLVLLLVLIVPIAAAAGLRFLRRVLVGTAAKIEAENRSADNRHKARVASWRDVTDGLKRWSLKDHETEQGA